MSTAYLLERLLLAGEIFMAMALLAWLVIGYLLFRTYRQTRPDWHERNAKN